MSIPFLKKVRMSPSLRPRVKFAWALMLLYQVGFVLSWIVITSLFVEEFGISKLPMLFAAEAALIMVGSILTQGVFSKMGHDRFLRWVLGTLFVLIGVAFVFRQSSLWLFFGAAIAAKDLVYPHVKLGIARKCEEIFTPTEAQRAVPIVESGLTIGMIASSALVLVILWAFPMLPTHNVLFGWSLPLFGILALLTFEPKILGEIPHFHNKKIKESDETVPSAPLLSMIQKHSFVKFLTVVALLQGTLFAVTEFEFMKLQSSHFEHHETITTEAHKIPDHAMQASLIDDVSHTFEKVTEAAGHTVHSISSKVVAHKTLMHDLGWLSLLFGLVALLVQFLLSPLLLQNFGIVRTMTAYFAGFLAMSSMFLFGSAGMINWVRGYEHGFHSLFMAGYHLSFYSTFSHVREKFRLFLECIVAPAGMLIGVALLTELGEHSLKYAMVGLAFLLMIITLMMRRSFTKFSTTHLHTASETHEKMHAIEILGQKGHDNSAILLSEYLRDENRHPVFRKKIIQTLTRIGDPRVLHSYLGMLRSGTESNEIKTEVLDSLLQFKNLREYWRERAFTQHQTQKTLSDMFEKTEDDHQRKLLAMNILRHLPLAKTVTFLQDTLHSADEKLKSICLRSCAGFDDPEIRHYLRPYLNDESTRIRSHAVIALWKIDNQKKLWGILKPMLESDNFEELISGIYALGEIQHRETNIDLATFIDHDHELVRLHSLIALGKHRNKKVVSPLIEMLLGDDLKLSRAVMGMSKRLPAEIREQLEHALQHHVSRKVHNVLKKSDLSKTELSHLYRLYHIAGRHEDTVLLEKFGVQCR